MRRTHVMRAVSGGAGVAAEGKDGRSACFGVLSASPCSLPLSSKGVENEGWSPASSASGRSLALAALSRGSRSDVIVCS